MVLESHSEIQVVWLWFVGVWGLMVFLEFLASFIDIDEGY